LDRALPAEAAASPSAAPSSSPSPSAGPTTAPNPIPNSNSNPSSPGSVQWVIEEQLRLMARQLELLRGGAPAVQPAPALAKPDVQIAAAPPIIAAPPATDDCAPQKYDAKKAFGAIARIHTQRDELTPKQKAR